MAQNPQLRIFLLGPMRIERDGVSIRLPRRKVESLLAYLILHPQEHTRDRLATLLWGDSSDEQARHSLRTALATVRQQIGADLLLTSRDHVQLNPDFPMWVDLHHLLALDAPDGADAGALQEALGLWQGELLAGFYDEWIAAEREHYATRLLELFLQIIQSLRARSDYQQAIAVAQKVLAIDPANEHAHQHLMFCYVTSGDRPAALRQYELCARALRDELDADPLPETTALYHWIKQHEGEDSTAAARITNLPIPASSFVGRTRETAEVKQLLCPMPERAGAHANGDRSGVRLLTLLGAGGNGKTRLAIQTATDLIDRFPDGVWWVELAGLSDGRLVARATAKTLGVYELADEELGKTMANALRSRKLLLVLDNCEHLIEACARFASELLESCPHVQVLATSREPLRISGERLWPVPPFAAPDPERLALVDLLMQFESIRLFVERAASVSAGFTLTPANAQAVAEICFRLDGIPLAIELAAARARVLSVEQIAAYLASALGARFSLLTQGSRAVLPRHQTLRATIDWSYDLLDDAERALFRQAAIFPGGFTLEALEQVAGESAQLRGQTILELLTQLVDKSLVIVTPHGAQNRYRLLDTLREYALEQYPSPDEMTQAKQRHADVFLRLARAAEPELVRAQQHAWIARLDAEADNLRAALSTLIDGGDGEKAMRLATALQRFWDYRGCHTEGRQWLSRVLAQRETAPETVIAGALNAAGWLAYRQGDLEQARRLNEEALRLHQQAEEGIGIANSLRYLAIIDMDQGDYTAAQKRMEESIRIARELNYQLGAALALSNLGGLAWDQDRFADARDYHLESLRIQRQLGNQTSIAFELLAIGDAERMLGNLDAARAHYDECLAAARGLGNRGLVGATLKSMGLLAFRLGEYDQARRYGDEALSTFRDLGDRAQAAFAQASLGEIAHKLGRHGEAWSYYIEYLQTMHEIGYRSPTFYALEKLAGLLAEVEQRPDCAARFLSAAALLRQELNIPIAPYEQERHDHTVSALRRQLGSAEFDAQWQAGEVAPLARIVAEAAELSLS